MARGEICAASSFLLGSVTGSRTQSFCLTRLCYTSAGSPQANKWFKLMFGFSVVFNNAALVIWSHLCLIDFHQEKKLPTIYGWMCTCFL